MKSTLPVTEVMTALPNGIGVDQSIASAEARMRRLGLRHLPVFDEGKLAGVVSDRDIAMIAGVTQLDLQRTSVAEIMQTELFTVPLSAPLHEVSRELSTRKIGSAIVVDDGKVVGIVTTTDLLSALSDLLLFGRIERQDYQSPDRLRTRLLREHKAMRRSMEAVEALLDPAENDREEAVLALRSKLRDLYATLSAHLEREERLLAPMLRSASAFGQTREAKLLADHSAQRQRIADHLADAEKMSNSDLVASVRSWIPTALRGLEREEQEVLTEETLSDIPVIADSFGG